jgi:hypothetical protein
MAPASPLAAALCKSGGLALVDEKELIQLAT